MIFYSLPINLIKHKQLTWYYWVLKEKAELQIYINKISEKRSIRFIESPLILLSVRLIVQPLYIGFFKIFNYYYYKTRNNGKIYIFLKKEYHHAFRQKMIVWRTKWILKQVVRICLILHQFLIKVYFWTNNWPCSQILCKK